MSERVHVEERHAYLIVAHKSDKLFEILCDLLDDDRNDIFIHMDVKNQGYNSSTIENKSFELLPCEKNECEVGRFVADSSDPFLA